MREKDFRKIFEKCKDLKGASTRKCQKWWRELNGNVDPVRRTGETRYRHPSLAKPITAGRGKDANLKILDAIRQLVGNHADDRKEDRRASP